MIGTASPAAVRRAGPPRVLIAAIAAAWIVAVVAQATGGAAVLHHDALIQSGVPLPVAVGLFLVAWQLMIVAMMLPSSLPLVRMFRATAANQPDPRSVMTALLAGYALVWSAFGALAFLGDIGLHGLVDRVPWLEAHPQVIAGSVLLLAGLFQFSDLKDRCLRECRHPGAFLLQHYGRGPAKAFRLGLAHGRFCLGCCWALMLVAFAVGVANLWWMAAMTAVMVYEKTGSEGDRAVVPTGIAMILLGGLALAAPAWSPL